MLTRPQRESCAAETGASPVPLRWCLSICHTQIVMPALVDAVPLGPLGRLLLALVLFAPAQAAPQAPLVLHYKAHWRFWYAGDVTLRYEPPAPDPGSKWQAELALRTRGFVGKLYHVDNHYSVLFDRNFCAASSLFRVHEGGKRREIRVTYQQPPGKVSYLERDLKKDRIVSTKELDVPPCVHDELAALARLRTMSLEPGQRLQFPISNGKKFVSARVDVLRRVQLKTRGGDYDTILCEAFLFNNVLYRRKGRLFIWLTDDEQRIPVQIRIRLRFYIGTVTLQLVKEDKES